MENNFIVEHIPEESSKSIIYNDRDVKEQLLQYNLNESLIIKKFRFTGQFISQSNSEYQEVLESLFAANSNIHALGCTGEVDVPVKVESEPLSVAVMSMAFFDRLNEHGIMGPGGRIKGCFDDTFDGVTVGDLLREMLVNENSENSCVFKESEKQELIYQLFRIFAIGGELCQPEIEVERYLTITKAVYKDIVTVFRDSKTKMVQVSGKAFKVTNVPGLELFPENPSSSQNVCIAIVDPMKRLVSVVKNTRKRFW
eukprot:gene25862-31230_t